MIIWKQAFWIKLTGVCPRHGLSWIIQLSIWMNETFIENSASGTSKVIIYSNQLQQQVTLCFNSNNDLPVTNYAQSFNDIRKKWWKKIGSNLAWLKVGRKEPNPGSVEAAFSFEMLTSIQRLFHFLFPVKPHSIDSQLGKWTRNDWAA